MWSSGGICNFAWIGCRMNGERGGPRKKCRCSQDLCILHPTVKYLVLVTLLPYSLQLQPTLEVRLDVAGRLAPSSNYGTVPACTCRQSIVDCRLSTTRYRLKIARILSPINETSFSIIHLIELAPTQISYIRLFWYSLRVWITIHFTSDDFGICRLSRQQELSHRVQLVLAILRSIFRLSEIQSSRWVAFDHRIFN